MKKVYHTTPEQATQLSLFDESVKKCRTCKNVKSLVDFPISRGVSDDGYAKTCQECTNKERERGKARSQDQSIYRKNRLESLCLNDPDGYTALKAHRAQQTKEWQAAHYTPSTRPKPPIPQDGNFFCCDCNKEYPIDKFYKKSHYARGYSYSCKVCDDKKSGYVNIGKLRDRTQHIVADGNKWCYGCDVEKSLNDFHKSNYKNRGVMPTCKECRCADSRAYIDSHREEIYAKHKEWYQKEENRLKILSHNRKRKLLLEQVSLEEVSYERILERDGLWCYICEQDILPSQKIDFDHFIPVSRGGMHSEDNIFVTHMTCNRRKHARLIEEMTPRQRRGPDPQ